MLEKLKIYKQWNQKNWWSHSLCDAHIQEIVLKFQNKNVACDLNTVKPYWRTCRGFQISNESRDEKILYFSAAMNFKWRH